MISYTYKILDLRKKDESNFTETIKSIKVRITGTKSDKSFFVDESLILDTPTLESFIEYNSLTEQNLIDWYQDGIREEMAQYQIQEKFNLSEGTQETSFPWSE